MSKYDLGKLYLSLSFGLWIAGATLGVGWAFGKEDFGRAFLFATAAFWCGMLLGFLFGVPKLVANQADPQPKPGVEPAAEPARLRRYLPNTNFTDISDWLTKIVVGLGLVNLNKAPAAVQSLGVEAAKSFGARPHLIPLINATLVMSAVIGLFVGYLTTRIFWAPQFSDADQEADRIQERITKDEIREIKMAVSNAPAAPNATGDVDAFALLFQKADAYLKINDADLGVRTQKKTLAAAEMGKLIVQGRFDRAKLARETNEGVLVGLANAIISEPEPDDMDRILSFGHVLSRLHVQYVTVLAYIELLKRNLVPPGKRAQMLRLLEIFEKRADASLKRLIEQAKRASA